MRFCKYCGNQVADNSNFCGKCGHEIERQGPNARPVRGVRNPLEGLSIPIFDTGRAGGGVVSTVQGVLMLVLAVAVTFLPILETSSLFQITSKLSFSVSGPSLVSAASKLPQYKDVFMSELGSYASSIPQISGLTDGWNGFGFWMTVVGVLLVVAMVGTFITAARCLENTSKSTLITGWLFLPYALVSMIVVGSTVSKVNDFMASLAAISGETTAGLGGTDLLNTTFWPWVILLLSLVCGVLGIVRHASMKSGVR